MTAPPRAQPLPDRAAAPAAEGVAEAGAVEAAGRGVPVMTVPVLEGSIAELVTIRVDEAGLLVDFLGLEIGVGVEVGVTVEVGVMVEVDVKVEVGVGVDVGVGVLVEQGPVTVTGMKFRFLLFKVWDTVKEPSWAMQEA